MKRVQISRRLEAVAGLVGEGRVTADVGCDHGYISIYLVQTGRVRKSIAMDINQGPLLRAREHIREQGLENYIETRLGDGLKAVKPGEVQSVILAGMGGPLMEKILTEGEAVLDQVCELVLQPQSEIEHFRRFLSEKGWKIVREDMVLEEGKFYPVMKALRGKTDWERAAQYRYGGLLLQEKNPVLKDFLDKEEKTARAILEGLKDSDTEAARRRREELEREREIRKEALAYYEM